MAMDTKNLIHNLIDAIAAIPDAQSPTAREAISDAKETASLARLVLPTLDAAPPAPAGGIYVLDMENMDAITGPFADEQAAQAYCNGLLALASDLDLAQVKLHELGAFEQVVTSGQPQPGGPQSPLTGGPSGTIPTPPAGSSLTCPDCGGTTDANGDCVDPQCPANPQATNQSYDEVLDRLKAGMPGRPGSVIANKPAGSLYRK